MASKPLIPGFSQRVFGKLPDGRRVDEYLLRNSGGMEVRIITYGGIVTSWTARDREGRYQNIALGFDSLEPYLKSNFYLGALAGRYANRIAGGSFTLAGKSYNLPRNDGPNHLHGGILGFDKVLWKATPKIEGNCATLLLEYTSDNGEEGYPGRLEVSVRYTLLENDALQVDFSACSDQKTIVSLTQHTYFNLSGDFSQNILDHQLRLSADRYLPVDEHLIPSGEMKAVMGTPFDFRHFKLMGADIETDDDQLKIAGGYDHCWIPEGMGKFRSVAFLFHPSSGRYLEIETDQPGIQCYSGNFLDGQDGKVPFIPRSGMCLETQALPDAPNKPHFPQPVLNAGETYHSRTVFSFSTK